VWNSFVGQGVRLLLRPCPKSPRTLPDTQNLFGDYTIGSPQDFFRRQVLHWAARQTLSNWFIAASTNSGLSVRMPASKLGNFLGILAIQAK
jgi:hypothetical protein